MEALNVAELVGTGLTSLIGDATSVIETSAPAVIGVVALLISVNIGIKLFKRFSNKIV